MTSKRFPGKVNVLGEPMMSKRGLYSTLNEIKVNEDSQTRMNFLSLCDGQNSLLEIAEYLNLPIWELYEVADLLKNHELIEELDKVS